MSRLMIEAQDRQLHRRAGVCARNSAHWTFKIIQGLPLYEVAAELCEGEAAQAFARDRPGTSRRSPRRAREHLVR